MKKIILASLIFAAIKTHAQSSSLPALQQQFIGLFVNNFDSSLQWYQQKLGFTVAFREDNPQAGAKFAILQRDNYRIEMIEHAKVIRKQKINEQNPGSIGIQGFFKPGFAVADPKSLQKEFEAKGAKIRYPYFTNDKMKFSGFIIEDAEGNLIQFYKFD